MTGINMIHVPYGGNRLEVLSRKYFRLKQRLIFAPGTVSKWYQKKRRAILPRLVAVLSLQHTALFPPRHRRHDGCGCARSARRPADGRLAQRCATSLAAAASPERPSRRVRPRRTMSLRVPPSLAWCTPMPLCHRRRARRNPRSARLRRRTRGRLSGSRKRPSAR